MADLQRISLTPQDRMVLIRHLAGPDVEYGLRARIVLSAASGVSDIEIGAALGVPRARVWRWRRRFQDGGIDALFAAVKSNGRPVRTALSLVERIVRLTTSQPPAGVASWTTRKLADHVGVSPATVLKVWRTHGVRPAF